MRSEQFWPGDKVMTVEQHETARVGDFVTVISDQHQHGFAKLGDSVQILKIIEGADFYEVKLNDNMVWVHGFKLAQYV